MLQCTNCRRIILDSTSEGGWKLRTRMLIFQDDGTASAICPSCKTAVKVPVQLDGTQIALPKPTLFVKPDN
jgi:hypothetical protein